MMQAELHGLGMRDVLGSEDYLTSTVFEHLRYLPANIFWDSFFSVAVDQSGTRSLLDHLESVSAKPSDSRHVSARFWPSHSELGCPDICLCFSGGISRPFVLIVEAKLNAGKSGVGEDDQLRRYLMLLDRLGELHLPISDRDLEQSARAVLYLTAQDALADTSETVQLCGSNQKLRALLFRAQWQDILDQALECQQKASGTARLILEDVAEFLRRRNLEYFRGFDRTPLPDLSAWDGFYWGRRLFEVEALPQFIRDEGYFYGPRRPRELMEEC